MVQQGSSKIAEIDIAQRKVVWTYDSATSNGNKGKRVEVHAFQPLDGGRVMIAESGPARIIEVDRAGKMLHQIKLKVEHPPSAHRHAVGPRVGERALSRLPRGGRYRARVRPRRPGHVGIRRSAVRPAPKPGHGPEAYGNKCFAAVRLPSGNTLISTGNGHRVLEVTPQKKIVWQIQQRELPGITLAWVTTLEVLPNGHYVIGNCHAGPGQPLVIELDPKTKRVVWTLDQYDTFGNAVSNSQILDAGGPVLR